MTIIDLFREFSSVAVFDSYPSSSRVLYYTMLWCWNERRRPEVVTMRRNELYTLAGLPESTFRDAFAYLADRGWVKRVKSRSRVEFAFILRQDRAKAAPKVVLCNTRTQSSNGEEGRIAFEGDSSPVSSKEDRDGLNEIPSAIQPNGPRAGDNEANREPTSMGEGEFPAGF